MAWHDVIARILDLVYGILTLSSTSSLTPFSCWMYWPCYLLYHLRGTWFDSYNDNNLLFVSHYLYKSYFIQVFRCYLAWVIL